MWNRVTIKRFVALNEVMNKNYVTDEDKVFAIMEVLYDKPKEYFENLPIVELKRLIEQSKFVFERPEDNSAKSVLIVNGNVYNVELKLSELTGGEYRDLSTLCKDEASINANYHLIMSLFMSRRDWFGRSVFKKWVEAAKTKEELIVVHSKITKERIKIAEELYNHMTMDKVFSYSNYFFLLSQKLITNTKDYLHKKAMKEMKKANSLLSKAIKKDLQNIGAGL